MRKAAAVSDEVREIHLHKHLQKGLLLKEVDVRLSADGLVELVHKPAHTQVSPSEPTAKSGNKS